mmetsp:Transcript_11855/g.32061  ORF Transcript_11855/g.32061 Transcript_11855/m.32061 type:complete len:323 (-) Transcript_11855:3660-4628(-)
MDKDGEKRGMQKGIYSAHLRKAPCPLSALLISSLHLQFFTPSKLSSERLGFPITLSSSTFNPFAIMLNFWLRLLFMSCMKLRMVDISPSKPSMRRRRRLGLGPDALSRFAYASDTFRLDSPFSSFPLAVVPRGRSCSSDEKSSSTSNKRSTSFAVNCALSSTTTSCLATTFSVIASTRLSSRRCSSLPLGLMESGLKNCLKRSPSTVRSSVCGSSFLSVHAWVRSSGSSDGTTLLVLSFSSSSTAVVLPSNSLRRAVMYFNILASRIKLFALPRLYDWNISIMSLTIVLLSCALSFTSAKESTRIARRMLIKMRKTTKKYAQ